MAVVVDTSVWIDYFSGRDTFSLDEALAHEVVILPPLVVAELVSGAMTPDQRTSIGELLQDAPIHEATLEHWIRFGELRRELAREGLNLTIPDGHVAQCALDADSVLLSRDEVFGQVARKTRLRLRVS